MKSQHGQDPTLDASAIFGSGLLDRYTVLIDGVIEARAATHAAQIALEGTVETAATAIEAAGEETWSLLKDPRVAELPKYQQVAFYEAVTTRAPLSKDNRGWPEREHALAELWGTGTLTAQEFFVKREQRLRPIAAAIEAKTKDDNLGVTTMIFEHKPKTTSMDIAIHGITGIGASSGGAWHGSKYHADLGTASFVGGHGRDARKRFGRGNGIPVDYYPDALYSLSDQAIATRQFILSPNQLTDDVVARIVHEYAADDSTAESIVLLGEDVVGALMHRLGTAPVDSLEDGLLRRIVKDQGDGSVNDTLMYFENELSAMTPNVEDHQAAWQERDHHDRLKSYGLVVDQACQQFLNGTQAKSDAESSLETAIWYCARDPEEGSAENASQAIVNTLAESLKEAGVSESEINARQLLAQQLLDRSIEPILLNMPMK